MHIICSHCHTTSDGVLIRLSGKVFVRAFGDFVVFDITRQPLATFLIRFAAVAAVALRCGRIRPARWWLGRTRGTRRGRTVDIDRWYNTYVYGGNLVQDGI